jgi:hypothetical protein
MRNAKYRAMEMKKQYKLSGNVDKMGIIKEIKFYLTTSFSVLMAFPSDKRIK